VTFPLDRRNISLRAEARIHSALIGTAEALPSHDHEAGFQYCILARPSTSADARAYTYSMPSSFHFLSTSALVFSSIRISSGQGRVNPSLAHLRVASIPIFDP
jgi:hypothetical protein